MYCMRLATSPVMKQFSTNSKLIHHIAGSKQSARADLKIYEYAPAIGERSTQRGHRTEGLRISIISPLCLLPPNRDRPRENEMHNLIFYESQNCLASGTDRESGGV